jgi:hypothetical protein
MPAARCVFLAVADEAGAGVSRVFIVPQDGEPARGVVFVDHETGLGHTFAYIHILLDAGFAE